jgi:transcriptional regulator with XRE-family HTH domain
MPAFSGALLRARRHDLRLTVEAVSCGVGRCASSVAKYESGAATPSVRVLCDLAGFLDCGVGAFFHACPDDARLAQVRRTLAG